MNNMRTPLIFLPGVWRSDGSADY